MANINEKEREKVERDNKLKNTSIEDYFNELKSDPIMGLFYTYTKHSNDNITVYLSNMCIQSFPCQHNIYEFNNDNIPENAYELQNHSKKLHASNICKLFKDNNMEIPKHFNCYRYKDGFKEFFD